MLKEISGYFGMGETLYPLPPILENSEAILFHDSLFGFASINKWPRSV